MITIAYIANITATQKLFDENTLLVGGGGGIEWSFYVIWGKIYLQLCLWTTDWRYLEIGLSLLLVESDVQHPVGFGQVLEVFWHLSPN